MKLPGYRRIFKSDYEPKDQSLVEKLSVPVNNGVEVLFEALNNKLTFEDNFQGTEVDIQVRVDASGIPQESSSFKLNNANVRIKRIWVGNAINLTNSNTYPTGAPFVSFVQNGGSIIITHITGLQANDTYLLNLLAT